VRDLATLAEILPRGAERFGAREALADPDESVSYAQLAGDASRLARAFVKLGLASGERSLVIMPNSVGLVRAHFANLQAGLVSVPCDAAIAPDTLAAVVASCAPRVLLTNTHTARRLAEAGALPPSLAHVVVLGPDSASVRLPQARDGMALAGGESSEPWMADRTASDLAALMYTTGTTGRPKGVMLTHANVLAALRSIVDFVGYTPDDREVVILPLSHNFGLGHVYCNLLSGGAVYTENGLARPGRVLKALASFRATGFPGTPAGFGLLLDQYAPVLADKGRGLRFSVINSAPLPPERAAQLQVVLPQLDIMVYYGLTEASRTAFISLTRHGPSHYRAVGRPMAHVQVEVRQGAVTVAAGETGEVVVRGAAVSRGYWEDAAQTAAAFPDGWLHTGDLGHVDHEGCLWITGRIKDLINTGGYKVIPGDVEKVLLTIDGVQDAGVAGLEGLPGCTGEAVVAGLVVGGGFLLKESVLQRHCLAVLEKFKVPVRFALIDAVPRTNTGKVKRAELARAIAARLATPVTNSKPC
jgi:long-chain acyl-CoA synthetase